MADVDYVFIDRVLLEAKGSDLIGAIVAQAEAAAAAAADAVTALNPYRVTLLGEVNIDRAGQVIRHPAMEVTRNGVAYATVSPATYTVGGVALSDFAIPTTTGGGHSVHYLDIAAIPTTTASPVKAVSASAVPAPAAGIVVLGQASGYDFTSTVGATVLYSKVAAQVDNLAFRGADIVYDARGINARDGASVIYVPLSLAYRLFGDTVTATAANAASAEMGGFAKIAVDVSATGVLQTLWYDPTANSFKVTAGGGMIVGTGKAQWVALASFYRGSIAGQQGVRIVDYAASLAENMTLYGTTMIDMPRKALAGGAGPFVAAELSDLDTASAAALSALGLVTGIKRSTGDGVIVGDTIDKPIRGARAFVRLYLYSSTGDFPANVNAYLKAQDGTSLKAQAMAQELSLTANLRSYVATLESPLDRDVAYIWAGPIAGVAGADLSLWGMQIYIGPRQVVGIWPSHYPTASTSLDAARPVTAGKPLLRRFASKAQRIEDGETAVSLALAIIGDSWAYRPMYAWRIARALQARYGAGGSGFLGFAESGGVAIGASAEDALAADGVSNERKFAIKTLAATWVPNASYTAPTANCAELTRPVANGIIQVDATNAEVNTRIALLYRPIAGSAGGYRWGTSGAFAPLDLSTGYVAALAGVPATGTWTLQVQCASASGCALTGLSMRKDSGVLVHKAGSPGSTSGQWAAAAASAGFRAHWAELGLDAATILLGTNDQTAGVVESVLAANYDAIATGLRAAVPNADDAPVDLLYAVPAENLRGIAPPMASYAQALYAASLAKGAAYLDLDPFVDKSAAWWVDTKHPTTQIGGAAIARAMIQMLDR